MIKHTNNLGTFEITENNINVNGHTNFKFEPIVTIDNLPKIYGFRLNKYQTFYTIHSIDIQSTIKYFDSQINKLYPN